jgi:Fe-S-cluster-containing dehydrogenase component
MHSLADRCRRAGSCPLMGSIALGAFAETILAHAKACTTCLACELACGFRWSKKMDPARSTIRVRRSNATGLVDIQILEGCDACRGAETPLCVQVCAPRVLSLGRKRAGPPDAGR